MFSISYFHGKQTQVISNETIEYQSLEEMAASFSEAIKGDKHTAYWVRGACAQRNDESIEKAVVLVIDADKSIDGQSCPSPAIASMALKELGYSHFVYTTHSHRKGLNKYRCVLLCEEEMVKADLKGTIASLMKKLNGLLVRAGGNGIANVREMSVWSQPWFIPTRDDPEDGLFQSYGWFNGAGVERIEGVVYESSSKESDPNDNESDPNENKSIKSAAERRKEVRSGENYHENLRDLSYMLMKDGLSVDATVRQMRDLMNEVPDDIRDDRWLMRYDDLSRIVREGKEKADHSSASEQPGIRASDIEMDCGIIDDSIPLPRPPGLMGELYDSCYEMMTYQYREVAMVTTLGLMAGMCGRKFNVRQTGLNLYMTLIMDTGMGKDFIGEWIQRMYQEMSPVSASNQSFFRLQRATGPKALADSLKDARSQIAIFTEAGFLLSSSSGDQDGLTRFILSLYTCSGANRSTRDEAYSDSTKRVTGMRAPAFSYINESTPKGLLKAFENRDSLITGELPRQSVFRVQARKPYLNMDGINQVVPDQVMERLKDIYKRCAEVQASDDPMAIEMLPCPEIYDDFMNVYPRFCVDLENDNRDSGDELRSLMATRAFVKVLKFSALASVLNYRRWAYIGKPEWEWAKQMIAYEMKTVDNFFAQSINSTVEGILMNSINRVFIKILRGEYEHQHTSKKEGAEGLIRVVDLNQQLRNNKGMKEYAAMLRDQTRQSAVRSLIEYMIRSGYAAPVKIRNAEAIKLTPSYVAILRGQEGVYVKVA